MSSHNRSNRVGSKKRALKQKMVIYCEGDVTEPEYLEQWRDNYCNVNNINKAKIKLYIVIKRPNSESDPKSIMEKMLKEIELTDLNYIVFDEDDRCDDITKKANICSVFDKANTNSIKCIFSNRCAEVWALLHFEYSSAPLSGDKIYERLHHHMESYSQDNKRFDISLMIKNEEKAMVNAIRLREEQERNSPGDRFARPMTNFDLLINDMKEFINKVNKEY